MPSIGDLEKLITVPEISALQPLTNSLNSMFESPEEFYSDAKLVLANGQEVYVHRCLLSARIPLFRRALATTRQVSQTVKLELKEIAKDFDVGFDAVVAVLAYVYSNRVRQPPKEISSCLDKDCCHMWCRPRVDFMMEVLYVASILQITELVSMYQMRLLEIIHTIRTEDVLVLLKLASICGDACKDLLDRCIEILVKSDVVGTVSLNKSLPLSSQHIVKQIIESCREIGLETPEGIFGIHGALDNGDIDLVLRFHREGEGQNVVDAYALHYVVAYSNVKTTMQLRDLNLIDINQKNPKGYTVLHVATMRKEPELIISLLTKGAIASATTLDGRTALLIAKQVTKEADYNNILEHGKPCLRSRLCVEILEQAEKQESWQHIEASPSPVRAADEFCKRLFYLENQVSLARSFFPMEAQVAMVVGKVEGTWEFRDENIASLTIQEEHQSRLRALSRSVEQVKCFFPRCSALLDSLPDLSDLPLADEDTLGQWQRNAKMLTELQDILMANMGKSALSSSTSKSTPTMRSSGKRSHRRQ